MVLTNEQDAIQKYRQSIAFVSLSINTFQDIVNKTINSENFSKSAAALLPFDKFAGKRIRFMSDNVIVKSMGVALMKMELEPARFSLGVSIEIANEKENDNTETTIMVLAGKSYNEIIEYVKSKKFLDVAKAQFEQQIENFCYKRHQLMKDGVKKMTDLTSEHK